LTHSERAHQYARDVVDGRVLACKWVRLACQRHLDDMERRGSDGFPYVFDAEKADRKAKFLELLPHVKGRWAREKQTLKLEDWDCFIVCSIYGWVHEDTGLRRFRKASVYVPRKNGKSFKAAGVGVAMFVADDEPGAEVYSGAATEKQAWEVFGPARQIAKKSPDLVAAAGIEVNAKTLTRTDLSTFAPMIGKPGDGASPHCAIIDEFHEHATSDQYDTMLTGMGAREQPLMFVISTAGDDIEGPCYDDWRTVERILERQIGDEEHFGIIYTIDDGDDWTDPAALEKANPNIGVSVGREFLLARQREAVQNARHQYRFKIKHLNVWVTSRAAYHNSEKWRENGDDSLSLDGLCGRPCYIGADLASKVDVAALGILFPPTPTDPYQFIPRFYVPEDRLEEPEGERYRGWAADEHLITTDGSRIDLQRIQDDIAALASEHEVLGVAYDPWQAAQLASNLEKDGLLVVEFRQTVQTLSEPMKESEALSLSGGIIHDASPIMSWMIGNVVARFDAKDNVYPRKEREQDKIDGPVALYMALGMAIREENPEPAGVHVMRDEPDRDESAYEWEDGPLW
jgi:phage terminase large subunit-like protein